MLWASGAQDLLSVLLALATILLYMNNRYILSGIAFLLALLSKEVVALLPLILLLLDQRQSAPWRTCLYRLTPVLLAGTLWGAIAIYRMQASPAAQDYVAWTIGGTIAAFVHLPQILIGAEWVEAPSSSAMFPPLPVLLCMLAAVILVYRTVRVAPSPSSCTRGLRNPLLLGIVWALLATVPITGVAHQWSAYYYLFALCGASMTVGALIVRLPPLPGCAVVLLLLCGSQHARSISAFSTSCSPWNTLSHVNPHHITRAQTIASGYLKQLKSHYPSAPRRATFAFANLPSFNGIQTADGPFIRWAYRDTTLRSYYATQLPHGAFYRGPLLFFEARGDTLRNGAHDRQLYQSIAYSMILANKPELAAGILRYLTTIAPGDQEIAYWFALAAWDRNHPMASMNRLRQAGVHPDPGPSAELNLANRAIASGDTSQAIAYLLDARRHHGLDLDIHSRLAAICLARSTDRVLGVIEAFAVTRLSPDRADGWRKLAAGQLAERQFAAAEQSLARYLQLGDSSAAQDAEAHQVFATLVELRTKSRTDFVRQH